MSRLLEVEVWTSAECELVEGAICASNSGSCRALCHWKGADITASMMMYHVHGIMQNLFLQARM
jgi:hypothetical protein